MTTVNLNQLSLNEFTGKEDPKQHCRATFPLLGAHGSRNIATVYIEIAPGDNLGMHTDSAEELLVILEGRLEIIIGREKEEAGKGEIALVPKLIPHDIRNIGMDTARVLGVFGGTNNVVATFDKEWVTTGSRVVDTAQLHE